MNPHVAGFRFGSYFLQWHKLKVITWTRTFSVPRYCFPVLFDFSLLLEGKNCTNFFSKLGYVFKVLSENYLALNMPATVLCTVKFFNSFLTSSREVLAFITAYGNSCLMAN